MPLCYIVNIAGCTKLYICVIIISSGIEYPKIWCGKVCHPLHWKGMKFLGGEGCLLNVSPLSTFGRLPRRKAFIFSDLYLIAFTVYLFRVVWNIANFMIRWFRMNGPTNDVLAISRPFLWSVRDFYPTNKWQSSATLSFSASSANGARGSWSFEQICDLRGLLIIFGGLLNVYWCTFESFISQYTCILCEISTNSVGTVLTSTQLVIWIINKKKKYI